MTRAELIKHEGESVEIRYKNEIAPQIRSGILFSVTMKVVIFWPFEHDTEIQIKFKNINKIKKL